MFMINLRGRPCDRIREEEFIDEKPMTPSQSAPRNSASSRQGASCLKTVFPQLRQVKASANTANFHR